jgi:SAM-dependent methyltransferase
MEKMSEAPKTLLHVGCGQLTLSHLPALFQSGWIETRVDVDPDVSPDIVADMTDMGVIAGSSYDAVYSAHNLEHLYPDQVALALAEFKRVLVPGGMVFITTPDLLSAAEAVIEKGLDGVIYDSGMGPITALDMIFGHTGKVSEGNRFMAHRTGFTAASLEARLVANGFINIALNRKDRALWATGFRALSA